MRKLYYNPLLEEDDFFETDNRTEWERYIEGLEQVSKLSAEEWFAQIDSDPNPF